MIQREYMFTNIVSLGWFCGVASDLERMGLRNESLPFDWILSPNFSSVIGVIKDNFIDFLDKGLMAQSKDNAAIYRNVRYLFDFYHDFDRYTSFDNQFDSVAKKYNKRAHSFMKAICEPTLFIRYINSSLLDSKGESIELLYIRNNYNKIQTFIKSFNDKNHIIFIYDKKTDTDFDDFYYVDKDSGDVVCRHPLFASDELKNYFKSIPFARREENLKFLNKKNKKIKLVSPIKRFFAHFKKKLSKEYKHSVSF